MRRHSTIGRIASGPKGKIAIALAALALIAVPMSAVLASDQFSDVPTSAFYHDQVNAIANAGITGGCGGTKYCPNNAVTRGQMAVFLDRLGNLSNEKGAVVDALSVNGEVVFGFLEDFELAGGATFECEQTTAAPFVFGQYSAVYQLYDVEEALAQPAIETHEVVVSVQDDPATLDSVYNVCFHRLSGNLSEGTYHTYGSADLAIGQGIFASANAARAKIAQFKAARQH